MHNLQPTLHAKKRALERYGIPAEEAQGFFQDLLSNAVKKNQKVTHDHVRVRCKRQGDKFTLVINLEAKKIITVY